MNPTLYTKVCVGQCCSQGKTLPLSILKQFQFLHKTVSLTALPHPKCAGTRGWPPNIISGYACGLGLCLYQPGLCSPYFWYYCRCVLVLRYRLNHCQVSSVHWNHHVFHLNCAMVEATLAAVVILVQDILQHQWNYIFLHFWSSFKVYPTYLNNSQRKVHCKPHPMQ